MFLHLVDAVGEDLSRYDDTEAWPSLFDDFVEWANDRANQNVQVNNKDDQAAWIDQSLRHSDSSDFYNYHFLSLSLL